MTTVVFKDGIVASDSRLTEGDHVMTEAMPKIWLSSKHPVIYGGCGECCTWFSAARLLDMDTLPWNDPKWFPYSALDLGEKSALMIVDRSGAVYYFQGKSWFPVTASCYAMGSGASAARGAMLAGADAITAVEIACRLDTGSALPVNVLRVEDIRAPAVKRVRRRRR